MPSIPWRAVLLAALMITLTSGVVVALTPESQERLSVRELLDTMPHRRLVLLEGTVRSAALNRLLLSDGTGEIRLNTCPAWYRPLAFGARETVRVVGQLAAPQTWRNNQPVFLVYRLQGEYGTRVTLRYSDGVPLWHQYRAVPGRRLQWEIAREQATLNWPRPRWTSWN